jgi:hypothetical protein
MLLVLELGGTGLREGRDVLHYIFHFRGELAQFGPEFHTLGLGMFVVVTGGKPDSEHREGDNLV